MSRRNPPSETTVATVRAVLQGVVMLGLFVGGPLFLKGLYSGAINPTVIAANMPHYQDMALTALTRALTVLVVVAVFVTAVTLCARHGRAWAASWWRYRRRWARVVTAHGLTGTDRKRVLIPQLRAITTGPHGDTVTVAMLTGQSPQAWDQASANLAAAFGATHGRVTGTDPHGNLDLEFARPPRRNTPTHPNTVVPALPAGQRHQLAASVRAWSLQFSWAQVRVSAHDGLTSRSWFAGRVRWNVMNASGCHSGYYAVGGLS